MTEPLQESGDHITDLEAKALANFMSDIGEFLHLPRYRYSVMTEPCDDDALASIHTVKDRHIAQVYVSREWMDRSLDERINTAIHEVCHLLHREVDNTVKSSKIYMHDWEFSSVWSQYNRQIELMVDYLAMFLQDFTKLNEAWTLCYSKAEAELAG